MPRVFIVFLRESVFLSVFDKKKSEDRILASEGKKAKRGAASTRTRACIDMRANANALNVSRNIHRETIKYQQRRGTDKAATEAKLLKVEV